MRFHEIYEALTTSQYRPLVKSWNKERYKEIFLNPKYDHDRNGYRVYIPFKRKKIQSEIEQEVSNEIEKHGYEVLDYHTGIAQKKDTNSKIKLTKILSRSDNHELLQKYNNDASRASSKNTEYMAVISRHPYDIAGMSTGRGWTSCMNLDSGEMRTHIPLDIKHGTIIAYVTNITDRNIENPIGRILIKPLMSLKNNEIILGVEGKVYGTNVPGFKETVLRWVDEINKNKKMSGVYILHNELYGDGIEKNKFFDKTLEDIAFRPQSVFDLENPTEEQLLTAIWFDANATVFQKIENPTEKMKQLAVGKNPDYLKYIKNPSEEVILAAVRKNPMAVKLLKNPSKEAQLAAINQNSFAIKYIDNPSEETQLAAVNQDGETLQFIENPSEEVQLAAVKQDGYAIQYIKNPSEEMQLVAVKQNGYIIQEIENPSPAVQLAAVKQKAKSFKYIKNTPIEEVKIEAAKKDWSLLDFMDDDISEKVQLAAINNSLYALLSIKHPTEKVQMIAVKENPRAISLIKNPTEKVQLYVVKKDPELIEHIKNPTNRVKRLVYQETK